MSKMIIRSIKSQGPLILLDEGKKSRFRGAGSNLLKSMRELEYW
jgi:hypothetical protein